MKKHAAAGRFKAECLALLDRVEHTRELIVVTKRGRLHDALALPRVETLALTAAVAVKAAELPSSFPGDPADRVIAASAILHSAILITKDERIRAYAGVRCLW